MKLAVQGIRGLLAAALVAVVTTPAHAGTSLLDTVKQRGVLNCGTDNSTPGFGYLNTKTGQLEGIDVDLCRAVAAAVLGDAKKVKFIVVTDKSRFNAVQTNQVDVVFAHTTVKPGRESAITVDFLPIYFYDGNGVMVKGDKIKSVKELNGATICTTQGSATEQTLAGYIKAEGWNPSTKVLTYENLEKLFAAMESGRCNGMATDRSALASWKANAPKPQDYTILPESLDKSPFAGFIVANDSRWRNALRWIMFATFQAEESKIDSKTIGQAQKSKDPFVQKFLGVNGSFGPDFGLPADFVSKVVGQVGNFGEIYNRNLGPTTPYAIGRRGTPNALWSEGGAIYSPPWI
ncbi:transporter substrate-binding domain-containing protein [Cupriavidus consociatus]|uniref:transporter substrate-binding domain-containing protein n=1 Tax=Cupriavidus consociatus TaxID=2821357 RepID=UPI001AE2B88E|nr:MULTISPECIES: transporter substrate-binding domain-containing protein [unclassified Cupriavidus]MBP0622338.1 transporter substrate-binding domain-containing protein [Cupriavidus sp. LEh25]MDK2659019.1 transporter substrate-binding domain-containing protein [Cupriavidus sp. LEh21]